MRHTSYLILIFALLLLTLTQDIKQNKEQTKPIDSPKNQTINNTKTPDTNQKGTQEKEQGTNNNQKDNKGGQTQATPQQTKPDPSLNGLQKLLLFSPRQLQLKKGQIKTFKYEVGQNKLDGDLYFIGASLNKDSQQTPKLKVSLGTKQFDCITKQNDVMCLVPQADFKTNDTFKITVSCLKNCSIMLEVYMNSQIDIIMNGYTEVEFHMNAAGVIINSQLPKNITSFSEVSIVATINNPFEIEQGFKMKAAVGKSLNTENVSYKYNSVSTWADGQGIFLTKQQIKAGDEIKVLISGPKNLRLTVMIYCVINSTRTAIIGEYIYDDVASSTKYYAFDISNIPDVDKSTIYIKLIRYSGFSDLTLLSGSVQRKQIPLGSEPGSNNHYFISPQQRKSSNIEKIFTLAVNSTGIATYRLLVQVDNKGYTQIQNGQAQFGIIQKGEIDNFIYKTQHSQSSNNNITITLNLLLFESNVTYGIKRCPSIEKDPSDYSCVYNNSQEVRSSSQSFNQIVGTYHNYASDNITQYIFSYDVSKCAQKTIGITKIYTCVFLVVMYTENKARYQLVLNQITDNYKNLQESIPYRDRLVEMKYNYYRFSLSSKENVSQVNFFLTTISGDCILLGSTTNKFPQLPKDSRVDDPEVKTHIYYLKFNETADAYYVSVFAYDASLYTIAAVVTRINSKNETVTSQIHLYQNVPHMNLLQQDQDELEFYIEGFKGSSFFIDIQQMFGYSYFEVQPVNNLWKALPNTDIIKGDSSVQIIQTKSTQPSNYIVKVFGQGVFSIQYSRKGGCILYRFSKPIYVLLKQNVTRCYSYEINDMDDIELSSSIGNYDGGINNVNITIDINGTSFQMNRSTLTISFGKWIQYCPNLMRGTNNKTSCFMKVYATSYLDVYMSFVAQYQNQEILLLDGVYQRAKTLMSSTKPRHYYFVVDWDSTITVFLKSFTNTNYVINARIVSWRQYLTMAQGSVYPLFSYNNNITSQTSAMQTTSLIVNRKTLEKYNCSYNCLLLISVFTNDTESKEVSYDIQASQIRSRLYSGDSKLGFVEEGATDNYEIKTSIVSESTNLTLKVIPFTQNCAMTSIRYRLENSQDFVSEAQQVVNNTYIIPAHDDNRMYIVQVDTRSTCSYQISLLASDGYVHLLAGVSFDSQIKQGQVQHYLYQHKSKQTVNILAMAQYGSVKIEATPLSEQQLNNISALVAQNKLSAKYSQSSNVGALQINKDSNGFCENCYYLIKLIGQSDCSIDLAVYPQSTPVQIRSNRVINDKIHIGDRDRVYRYYSTKTFFVNFDISVGEALINVIRKIDNKTIHTERTTVGQFITVPATSDLSQISQKSGKAGWDMFGEVYVYEIIISSANIKSAVAYNLVVKDVSDPMRLKEGIPFTINIKDRNKCVTFASTQSNSSGYLILTMNDTTQFSYTLNCNKTVNNKTLVCGPNLLVKESRNPQSVNAQVRLYDGVYTFCVTMMKLGSITVLLSRTNMIHLQPNKPLFIDETKMTQTFDVYNPNLQNVMIQVFECKGRVGLLTTSNYSELQKKKDAKGKVVVERSKTAGHYISTYEVYSNQPVVQIFTSVIPQYENNFTSYIVKYSHYMSQNPYKFIEPDSLDITYDITEQSVILYVKKIVNFGLYDSGDDNNYTLYITDSSQKLSEIANCQITKAEYQSSQLQNSNPALGEEVKFEIPLNELALKFNNKYFYATISAVVKASGFSRSSKQHHYKVIYNTIQINPNIRTIIDKKNVELKQLFVWVIIPIFIVAIILMLACRTCIKGMRYNPITDGLHLIEQPDNNSNSRRGIQQSNPSATVLVEPRNNLSQPQNASNTTEEV